MKLSVTDEDLKGIVQVVRLYGPEVSNTWRYTITHMIRLIHDREKFPVTKLVHEQLGTSELNKYGRQKYNRSLKDDSLMIEHMTPVAKIVSELFRVKLPADNDLAVQEVRKILELNTNCIVKFSRQERDLQGK